MLTIAFALCLLAGGGPAGAAKPASSTHERLSGPAQVARAALQQALLTPADAAAGDFFGRSVAISGDTAVVGAPEYATAGLDGAGAAYIFTRSAGIWTQQAQLSAADAASYDSFGAEVAVSGDTALIAAPRHATAAGDEAGAAYIFTRSGTSWSQQAQLTAVDGAAYDWFGGSLALAGDTALVGAPYHAASGKDEAGAAYVFTRAGTSWTQQAKVNASNAAAGDWFGTSVALVGDTALIGADGHGAGAAYVFTRAAAAWSQRAQLSAADGVADDAFGASVALIDGTALVGSPGHDAPGQDGAGAAYVFTGSAAAWSQQAKLSATGGVADDSFGSSVALSGFTALVGAMARDTSGLADSGAAYAFVRSAGTWSQDDLLTASDAGAADWFGVSAALDGQTALVGASGHASGGLSNAGAAYVFMLEGTPAAPTITGFTPASGVVGSSVTVTGAGFTGATAVAFNGIAATTFAVVSDTQFTATVPAGATSGPITAATPGGTAASPTSFTVTLVPPAPTVSGFEPQSGVVGTAVTVNGAGFTGATAVTFNGTTATAFAVVSDTQLTATVPTGATTGPIAVTTPKGTGAGPTAFTVTVGPTPPTITSFLPASGIVGSSVTVTGAGFTDASAVTFNGVAATGFAVLSNSQISATVPAGATTGPIGVTTPLGTTASIMHFMVTLVPPPPTVSGFAPLSGVVGTSVTVTGAGFTGATAVTFSGVSAPTFAVAGDTTITATVPLGATSGPIAVTTVNGTGSSATVFTVTLPVVKPSLAKLSPTKGRRGTTVTITGRGFGSQHRASSVTFGSKKCTKILSWSGTRIRCKVPARAAFGRVSVRVTTSAGKSNARSFIVKR